MLIPSTYPVEGISNAQGCFTDQNQKVMTKKTKETSGLLIEKDLWMSREGKHMKLTLPPPPPLIRRAFSVFLASFPCGQFKQDMALDSLLFAYLC